MTGDGQAASALTNISLWAWALFTAAGLLAFAGLAYGAVMAYAIARDVAVIAVQLARSVIRRRKLITALAAVDGAQRPTGAMDLGDLVISREQERHAQWQAARLRDLPVDPDPALGCPCCPGARSNDCTCRNPCGDPMCQALDPPDCTWCTRDMGCAWPCTCAVACGDPGCLHG
jgi:hypothetical protein